MNIWVLDGSFNQLGLIEKYESLIWSDRHRKVGDIELVMAATTEIIALVKKDYYLVLPDYDLCYIVDTILLSTSVDGGKTVTISGRDLKSVLKRRIVWSQTEVSGTIQNSWLRLIEEAMIIPKDYDRRIPEVSVVVSGDAFFGDLKMDAQFSGDNIGEITDALCEAYEFGYEAKLRVSDNMSGMDYALRRAPYGVTYTRQPGFGYYYGPVSSMLAVVPEDKAYLPGKQYIAWARGFASAASEVLLYFKYTDGTLSYGEYFPASISGWVSGVSTVGKTVKFVGITYSSQPATTVRVNRGSFVVQLYTEGATPPSTELPKVDNGYFFQFSLRRGADRSYNQLANPWVVFSPGYENLIRTDYLNSNAAYTNVALVAGEGEGADRKTSVVRNQSNNLADLSQPIFRSVSNLAPGSTQQKNAVLKNGLIIGIANNAYLDGGRIKSGYTLIPETGTVVFITEGTDAGYGVGLRIIHTTAGGTYHISWENLPGSSPISTEALQFTDVGALINYATVYNGGTFTPAANCRMWFFIMRAPSTNGVFGITKLSIVAGSSALPFEPATGELSRGISRRELYVDAKDISSKTQNDDGTSTSIDWVTYKNLLDQRGTEKLFENPVLESFEGEVEGTRVWQYGKDYFLGDIVQVENEFGITGTTVVEEVVYSEDPSGIRIVPTFRGEITL